MFALLIAGTVWAGPSLVRDFIILADPVDVPEANIIKADCSVRRGFITNCSADISYEVGGQTVHASLRYLFVDPANTHYPLNVIRSAKYPGMATLGLGLDTLWNRGGIAVLFGLALLVGGAMLLIPARRTARQQRMLEHAVELVPLTATVRMARKGLLGMTYSVRYSTDGKSYRDAQSVFKRREKPLVIGKLGKHDVLLAVMPRQGGVLVVLDDALARVDFTAAERMALEQAVNATAA